MQHASLPPAAFLASLLLATASATAAQAGDYYVDAALGADVPAGGTPTQPWRTITYARTQVGGAGVTIHVGPGVYDAALGEAFPISMTGLESLLGSGGQATVVDGADADVALFRYGATADPYTPTGAVLAGMTLARAGQGVHFPNTLPPATPTLSGVRFDRLGTAVFQECSLSTSSPRFESCELVDCGTGLLVTTVSTNPEPVLVDCRFLRCGTGVHVSAWSHEHSGFSQVTVRLRRSVLQDCGIGVFLVEDDAYAIAQLEGSLVTGCGEAIRYSGVSDAVLLMSTVSGNAAGLVVPPDPGNNVWTTLESSIVWGNGVASLDPAEGLYWGGYSDTDPPLPLPGCTSVDPQFVDAAGGNLHLTRGSPLVDAGDPAATPVGTDLDLDPRVLDGDGDGAARVDMGFDELNRTRLASNGPPVHGATLQLSVRAAQGETFTVAVALQTADLYLGAFGSLLLDPASVVFQAAGASPGSVTVAVPADPALVGLSLFAQALSFQPVPPFVGSLSNRLDLVVE